MKITVVGCGHGGCAAAASFAKRGHDVSLLKLGSVIHNESFRVIRARGAIQVRGIEGEGCVPLCCVTDRPEEALPGAEVVFIAYVTNHHAEVARRCAPLLRPNQIVVLSPGYCGSLVFSRELLSRGACELPVLAEFETLPFSSRLMGDGTVDIASRNVRHPYSALPGRRTAEIMEPLADMLGECVPRTNVLEVSLHNPNLVIHTVGVLMNAAVIENPRWRFAMYRDGFSPSVWNVVMRLDAEKMDVLEKLGLPRIPYFDEFRLRTFENTNIDGKAGFLHYAAEAPDGPSAIDHRYVTEDVPMGLGLLHVLGKRSATPTPVCDSLIALANAMLPAYDFWSEVGAIDQLLETSLPELHRQVNG